LLDHEVVQVTALVDDGQIDEPEGRARSRLDARARAELEAAWRLDT
jgi:hypothetical protein